MSAEEAVVTLQSLQVTALLYSRLLKEVDIFYLYTLRMPRLPKHRPDKPHVLHFKEMVRQKSGLPVKPSRSGSIFHYYQKLELHL